MRQTLRCDCASDVAGNARAVPQKAMHNNARRLRDSGYVEPSSILWPILGTACSRMGRNEHRRRHPALVPAHRCLRARILGQSSLFAKHEYRAVVRLTDDFSSRSQHDRGSDSTFAQT